LLRFLLCMRHSQVRGNAPRFQENSEGVGALPLKGVECGFLFCGGDKNS
jgi:hypothetical protein